MQVMIQKLFFFDGGAGGGGGGGGSLSPPRLNIFTVGNMGIMICLGQGGLSSLSTSSLEYSFIIHCLENRTRPASIPHDCRHQVPLGLKPANICMWITCSTTVQWTPTIVLSKTLQDLLSIMFQCGLFFRNYINLIITILFKYNYLFNTTSLLHLQ